MITYGILLICLGIFVYINFISHEDKYNQALSLGGFYPDLVINENQYWRFLTNHFIHIDFLHFIFNAYALYELGGFFEELLGTIPYIYLVLISMLLSSLLTYSMAQIFENQRHTMTIGASGIVYGFFGAIVALAFIYGDVFYELFLDFIPCLAINFMYTLFSPSISKTGHIGGFIGGVLGIVLIVVLHIV